MTGGVHPKSHAALETARLRAERDEIREAVALHARTLDDLALGKPENHGRDRDDIDNDLYNAVRATSPTWWDRQVPGLNGPAEECPRCGGRGLRSSWVNEIQREVEGTCPDCEGTGNR